MEGALCYSDQNHGFLGSLCVVVSMVNRELIVWLDQNFGFGGSFYVLDVVGRHLAFLAVVCEISWRICFWWVFVSYCSDNDLLGQVVVMNSKIFGLISMEVS